MAHPSTSSAPRRVTVTRRGDTLESLAARLAATAGTTPRQARAILISNNGIRETEPIPPGRVVDLGGDAAGAGWTCDGNGCQRFGSLSADAQSLLVEDPGGGLALATAAGELEANGFAIGWEEVALVAGKTANIGLQVVDASAGGASKLLGAAKKAAAQLGKEAFAALGPDVVKSKKAADVSRLERFLRTRGSYETLRESLDRLPPFLTRQLGQTAPAPGTSPARWLRREVLLPTYGGNPTQAWGRVVTRLNGAVSVVGRIGTATTWVIPSAIGVYEVVNARPEDRLRVGIKEAAKVIVGGAAGVAGAALGTLLVTSLAFTGVGAFLVIAILAGAFSYSFSEGASWGVGRLFGEEVVP